MQFKKLAAMAGTALMTGLALAVPALGATVSEVGNISDLVTVADSTVSFPMFVVGASAQTADVAGSVNVAVNLAANAKTTEMVATTGASTEETVAGGVKIRTSGNELTPWETIQTVKPILTASDTSMLAINSFQSASGGSYQYKQYLYLGGETTNPNAAQIKFEKPTDESTPRIAFDIAGVSNLYTYKLTFSTPVALGAAVNTDAEIQAILQGQTIQMLGKDYIISSCTADDTNPIASLTLLGGKNVEQITAGTDKTVTVDGTDYVIHLDGVATKTVGSSNVLTAVGDVNGESFDLRGGTTDTLNDGTVIAAISVIQGKTGEPDYAKIAIGADEIKITNIGGTITKGTVTKSELTATITDTAAGGWSGLTITYQPDSEEWLALGESVTDPFASAFDMTFSSVTPDFDDTTSRQLINFSPASKSMLLTYENAGGEEKQMYTLYYDAGTWRWVSAVSLGVAAAQQENDNRDFVFDEGQNISAYEKDHFVIQKSGFSHIMQFTSFTPTSNELKFVDEAGNTITATNTTATEADLIVDGNSYKVYIVDAGMKVINVDLNANGYLASTIYASYSSKGTDLGRETSFLVPKLVTTGKGGIYFYDGSKTNILADSTGYNYTQIGFSGIRLGIVGQVVNVSYFDYDAATPIWTALTPVTIPDVGTATIVNQTVDYIDFSIECWNSTATDQTCNTTINDLAGGTGQMEAFKGFIVVQEENEDGSTHNWLYVPIDYDTTRLHTFITTPKSDNTRYDGALADVATTGKYMAMTTYGTRLIYYTASQGGTGELSYPDTYMYGNVYVMTPEGTITTTTSEGGEVESDKVLPITSDVVKLDSEVTDSDKTANDFVLVGGPCVNTLVADLATAEKFDHACDTWPGRDFGLIELVTDAFEEGNTALIIAGTRAADTDLACRVVQDGTKLEGNTAASVEVSGESFSSVVVS